MTNTYPTRHAKLIGTISGLFLLAGAAVMVVGTTINAFTPDQAKTTTTVADAAALSPTPNN